MDVTPGMVCKILILLLFHFIPASLSEADEWYRQEQFSTSHQSCQTLYFVFFQNTSKVTVSLTRTLELCLPNATECCPSPLCMVEALQVLACRGSVMLAQLLIQAEIFANSSFTGNVSGKC